MSDSRNKALKAPLRELLDDPIAHDDLERVRRRVHASRRLPPTSGWARAPMLAAAVVLLAGGFAWLALEGDGALTVESGEALASARGEGEAITRVSLSAGWALWLDGGRAMAASHNDGERVVLAQSDGRAVYDVRPNGPRRWSVRAGPLTVDVVGTRFSVVRRGARVRVELERGHVAVRGEAIGTVHLAPGEHVEVGAPTPPPEPPQPAAPPIAAAAEEAPALDTPTPDTPAPRVARPSSTWRALADRGAYADAFAALGERALGEASRQSVSEDELYALADTARLSGHPRLAVTPLRRLMDEHASGVAALTLGRLQLDALDDPRGATRSLARADALSVPAHLAETLLARRVEAHRRAGDADTARALAAAYLQAHPEGRYADRVRASAGDL
ncbi:MAG: FecR domain-containing protein [Sandaracinaceae bacterium]